MSSQENNILFLTIVHNKNTISIGTLFSFKHYYQNGKFLSQYTNFFFSYDVFFLSSSFPYQWNILFTGFNTKTSALDTFFFVFRLLFVYLMVWMYWKHSANIFFYGGTVVCMRFSTIYLSFITLHSPVNAVSLFQPISICELSKFQHKMLCTNTCVYVCVVRILSYTISCNISQAKALRWCVCVCVCLVFRQSSFLFDRFYTRWIVNR